MEKYKLRDRITVNYLQRKILQITEKINSMYRTSKIIYFLKYKPYRENKHRNGKKEMITKKGHKLTA